MIRGEGKIEFDGVIVGKGRWCQLFFSAGVIEEGTCNEERRGCRWGQEKMCLTVRFSS